MAEEDVTTHPAGVPRRGRRCGSGGDASAAPCRARYDTPHEMRSGSGRPPSLSSAQVPALMPQVSSNDLIRRVLRCLLSHRRRQGAHCPLSSVPRLHVSIAAAWSRQADTATNWAAASPPWYTTARPNSTPPAVLTRPCVIRQQLSTSDTTQRIRHRARTLPDCFTSHRIAQPEGWPGASL